MVKPAAENIASALENARAFMDAYFDQPLDLAQIAAHANYSPYHFIRAFRKTFYEMPHQYLIRKRLEKAKELLATTNLPVTEICFAVGFESLGSFSALFQKRVGWAPTVYRARVGNGTQPVQIHSRLLSPEVPHHQRRAVNHFLKIALLRKNELRAIFNKRAREHCARVWAFFQRWKNDYQIISRNIECP